MQFKAGLDKFQADLSIEDTMELLKELDKDGNGTLDLEEFVDFVTEHLEEGEQSNPFTRKKKKRKKKKEKKDTKFSSL